MKHLSETLSLAGHYEARLAEAFSEAAGRHGDDFEIARGCKLFADWSRAHLHRLRELEKKFGNIPVADGETLKTTPLQQSPGLILLRDIERLLTLAHQTRIVWTSLEQAAKALKDAELNAAVLWCSTGLDRTINWLETQLKNIAPQALLVS